MQLYLMNKFDSVKCPKCNKIATDRSQVERSFGLRVMNGKYTYVQSGCKECR